MRPASDDQIAALGSPLNRVGVPRPLTAQVWGGGGSKNPSHVLEGAMAANVKGTETQSSTFVPRRLPLTGLLKKNQALIPPRIFYLFFETENQ